MHIQHILILENGDARCSSGSQSKEHDGSSSCKVLDTVGKSWRMSCLLEKTKVTRRESSAILPLKDCRENKLSSNKKGNI